jgi:hypothetical protein
VPVPEKCRLLSLHWPEKNSAANCGIHYFRTKWAHGAVWIGLLVLLLTCGPTARAATYKTLTWDASPQWGLIGYKVYFGTGSFNYNQIITVGNATSATIDGLVAGTTYYFAVTAISASGEESDFSNEAIYVVPRNTVATLQINAQTDGGIRLTGTGETSHRYHIQATADFVVWTTIATRSADNTGSFEYLYYKPAAFPITFYRLQDLGAGPPGAQLEISVAADKVVNLTASAPSGNTYEIQATTDLITWTAIGAATADANGFFRFSDADATRLPARFYRLKDASVAAMAVQLQLTVNPNQVVELRGTGPAGHTYEIQASSDLVNWTAIDSETTDSSGVFSFTDYEAPNYPSRFYRARDTQQ